MGFFNFIETFFFISLGITFVLILLLVYHFKNRICTLEQKGNTMFEIVNGVVKELTNIKKMVIQQGIGASMLSMGSANMFSKANPEQVLVNGELKPIYPYQIPNHVKTSQVKSNQYNDDEESESDSDSDSDSSYTDEDGEDYEDGEHEELESNNTDTIVNEPSDEFDQPETVVINDEAISSVADETSIKIINYENESIENIDEELPEDVSEQSLEEINEVDLVHEEEENEIEGLDEEEVNQEHVVIKLDEPSESSIQNESVSETPVHSLKEKEDSYKRLTLNQLKATVIAKGITTDTSKLKKNELIKLLANFEEHATKE